jgi:hypothetical protein
MRLSLAAALLAAWPVLAADPPAPSTKAAGAPLAACADCGVVRSVRSVKKEIKTDPESDSRPSGLVATFPLGGGKAQAGSSTRIGKDKPQFSETWEVIVRLDDGRFRVVTLEERPELREGDQVRFDALGKIQLRAK